MSYSHGGGGRRYGGGYRDDRRRDREPQHHPPERPETRLQNAIIKFGDEITRDPQDEIPRMLAFLQSNQLAYLSVIAEGLKIGAVEQPYKIPYYALLISHFITPPSKEIDATSSATASNSELAKQFLDDFFKGFQGFVDKLAWREIRLCIHLFAHLTLLRIVSLPSMLALLQSFITVLNEPGVSHYRARNSALTAGEGLLRAGTLLYEHSAEAVNEMIASLKTFAESYSEEKTLVAPIVQLHSAEVEEIDWKESVACLISALAIQQANSFANTPASLPPIERKAPYFDGVVYDLPFVLVPPEVIELDDGLAAPAPPIGDSSDGTISKPPAKQEYPYAYLSLFPEDITPSDSTPAGYVVRSCIFDMLNIFEVNRKEGARILLELHHWWEPSTFKGGASTAIKNEEEDGNEEVAEAMGWSLENTIIESILSTSFLLPVAPHLQIYYYALITDLCKASPQTVGPAVGKSIRKLYKLLGEGLDVEVSRRFAEWFAIHMSNFAFNWVWKEWTPDLALPSHHPKKEFIRSSIQLEIRLAYYDRIKGSLPEDFHSIEAGVLAQEAPGPSFDFEAPDHPYYESAESLLALIRGRSKSDAVVQHAESMRHQIAESFSVSLPHASSIVRTIAVQSILHTGSRSFSHFLNAIERYLPLLRALSNPNQTSDMSGSLEEARTEILETVAKFWSRNSQMVGIVFDKLMQYQIVDPADIVGWAFRNEETAGADEGAGGLSTYQWVLLRAALDKATGRVEIAKGKVAAVKKAEEDTKSRAKARAAGIGGEDEMEVEVDDAILQDDSAQSPKLANALKAHATLTRDQKTALAKALDGFVSALGSSSVAHSVLSQESWDARDTWGQEWKNWETWCWYRQFCRMYAPQLKTYINTLESVSLSKLDSSDGIDKNAARLMRSIWRVALSSET